MKIIGLLIIICCLGSCKDKDGLPSGILKKDKMQEVFWNIIQAEAFTKQFIKKDSSKNEGTENATLQQQIFLLHKVSKEEFYNSYTYYSTHVELMRNLLDSMTAKAERDKYATLYGKPAKILPFRISLISRQPRSGFVVIPMPIPSLLITYDTTLDLPFKESIPDTIKNKAPLLSPIPAK